MQIFLEGIFMEFLMRLPCLRVGKNSSLRREALASA